MKLPHSSLNAVRRLHHPLDQTLCLSCAFLYTYMCVFFIVLFFLSGLFFGQISACAQHLFVRMVHVEIDPVMERLLDIQLTCFVLETSVASIFNVIYSFVRFSRQTKTLRSQKLPCEDLSQQ